MKYLRGIVLLMSIGFSAEAAQNVTPLSAHPVVGKWQWTRSENNCTEVYEYRSDGTLFVVSGAEESSNTYQISQRPDPNGFYELKGQIVKSNGGNDCSDSPPSSDHEPYTVYIVFHRTQPLHLVCQTPVLDRCFGPLRRIQD